MQRLLDQLLIYDQWLLQDLWRLVASYMIFDFSNPANVTSLKKESDFRATPLLFERMNATDYLQVSDAHMVIWRTNAEKKCLEHRPIDPLRIDEQNRLSAPIYIAETKRLYGWGRDGLWTILDPSSNTTKMVITKPNQIENVVALTMNMMASAGTIHMFFSHYNDRFAVHDIDLTNKSERCLRVYSIDENIHLGQVEFLGRHDLDGNQSLGLLRRADGWHDVAIYEFGDRVITKGRVLGRFYCTASVRDWNVRCDEQIIGIIIHPYGGKGVMEVFEARQALFFKLDPAVDSIAPIFQTPLFKEQVGTPYYPGEAFIFFSHRTPTAYIVSDERVWFVS